MLITAVQAAIVEKPHVHVFIPSHKGITVGYLQWSTCVQERKIINPARVTVVVLCVCVSVHGSNLLVAQLCVILTGSVSWSLQNEFGVFRIMASFRR